MGIYARQWERERASDQRGKGEERNRRRTSIHTFAIESVEEEDSG